MGWQFLWWVLGVAGLAGWARFAWPVVRALVHTRYLSRVDLDRRISGAPVPTVSVLVPACNEAAAIERCLDSLLQQDYPGLQIVAINDRSTDRTGEIMEAVARREPRLVVRHVKTLPAGWLGKNHANHVGAQATDSDWILFTDGDIIFEPDALAKAVAFAEDEGLDHLSLMPGLIPGGPLETAACCFFGLFFCYVFKTWHVRNPLRSDAFCGIGAFNLVRRRAYESIGGHVPLRLEVGDDVKLGKLFKRGGFISDVIAGWPSISVRWQIGIGGVIRGLEKNGFCGADYQVRKALPGIGGLIVLALLPVVGVVFAPLSCKALYAAWLVGEIGLLGSAARRQGSSGLHGLAFPIVCLAIAYAITRSMVLALRRGGIIWRGTLYPLEDLRNGLV